MVDMVLIRPAKHPDNLKRALASGTWAARKPVTLPTGAPRVVRCALRTMPRADKPTHELTAHG